MSAARLDPVAAARLARMLDAYDELLDNVAIAGRRAGDSAVVERCASVIETEYEASRAERRSPG